MLFMMREGEQLIYAVQIYFKVDEDENLKRRNFCNEKKFFFGM